MSHHVTGRSVHRFRRLIPLLVLVLAACDDPFGPGAWDARPDTVVIYSASRAEYIGLASAVDITTMPVVAVPIESPGLSGGWDVVLTDEAGGLALVPSSAFPGLGSRARIAVLPNTELDAVRSAPADTARYTTEAVQLQPGNVYVVRSRRTQCGAGSGYRYAKLQAVIIDVARGTYTFEIVRNPFCDDRSFVPPEN